MKTLAHQFYGSGHGGPLAPSEIALMAAGGLLFLVGLALVVFQSRPPADKGPKGQVKFVMVAVGLIIVIAGPRFVPHSLRSTCTRPSTEASVAIKSPADGQILISTTVSLEVEVNGATLSQAASIKNRPNEGHLHVALDGKIVSMTGAAGQTIEVTAGGHSIKVDLVANDHGPFCTRIEDEVTFLVQPA